MPSATPHNKQATPPRNLNDSTKIAKVFIANVSQKRKFATSFRFIPLDSYLVNASQTSSRDGTKK